MGHLPLFLNVEGIPCLVVGGGHTAHRKALMLLEAGARVVAVSPRFTQAFAELQQRFGEALVLLTESYVSRDLSRYRLVFAATGDSEINQTVAGDAQRANLWVNVVDEPALCSALCGAVLQRGPVQIAVSTGGTCPTLAAALRDDLAEAWPESLGEFAAALGAVRTWLIEHCPNAKMRRRILHRLASGDTRDKCLGTPPGTLPFELQREAERLMGVFGKPNRHD